MLQADRAIEEAAMDLGSRPWQVMFDITLPVISPAILSGWLLAFTISLDDVVITAFTTGPGSTTLPICVVGFPHGAGRPESLAREAADAVLSIGRGQLHRRVRVSGGGSLRALAEGVNEMAERLENAHASMARRIDEATAELRARKDEAERANLAKSRFLAAASHDLRQPLHAMGLFLESLQRSPLNDHQRTVLKHAHAASGAAAEMLTTLLDYSRLEAGVVKVRPDAFAVQPLLTALEQEFGVQADTAGLVYRTRETSAAAYADRSLVGLVMHNFISNALRYTARGGVLIACRTRGKRLALEVWDTGPGIPRSQWDNIFKEFHQLGNPERDRRKGLGLGLAIVQRLAREMKTSVEVLSRPGRGSVFRLWLDRWQGALEDDTAQAYDARSMVGLKVLAIDDDEGVRMGMQSLLQSWGCLCITAESGAQALEYLDDLTPDLIITDFRLRNEETGKQALQALRAYMGTPVPAIIMTGDTSPQRLRDAQSTSALLLHKPVSTGQLRTAIVHLITHTDAAATTQPAPLESDVVTASAAEGP